MPLRVLLRRQLQTIRNEAAWARSALDEGHQPPHGFEIQIASVLDSIASAALANAAACRTLAAELRARGHQSWSVHEMDRAVVELDRALIELSVQ